MKCEECQGEALPVRGKFVEPGTQFMCPECSTIYVKPKGKALQKVGTSGHIEDFPGLKDQMQKMMGEVLNGPKT